MNIILLFLSFFQLSFSSLILEVILFKMEMSLYTWTKNPNKQEIKYTKTITHDAHNWMHACAHMWIWIRFTPRKFFNEMQLFLGMNSWLEAQMNIQLKLSYYQKWLAAQSFWSLYLQVTLFGLFNSDTLVMFRSAMILWYFFVGYWTCHCWKSWVQKWQKFVGVEFFQ